MVELEDLNIYIITHGRPEKNQRRTTEFLDNSNLKYYFVMNEGQVENYIKNGVKREQIVISTNDFEKEYFKKNKTIDVEFHGAICNREMCNIHARKQGKKYAMQLDDNIIYFSISKAQTKINTKKLYAEKYFPKIIKNMKQIMEHTNIGFLGMTLGATPSNEKKIIRTGYAYSCFIENVEANINWRGPFDDDVLHNLDFNTNGKYTNALCSVFGYGKESKSKTGMRQTYDKYVVQRAMGVSNLYPDYVGVGIKPKANGKDKRIYHVFKKRLNQNIKIKNKQQLEKTIEEIKKIVDDWRNEDGNKKI